MNTRRVVTALERWAFGVLIVALATAVHSQPINDNFYDAIEIAGTNLTVHGSNEGATVEDWEPYPADVWSGASVWWKWTPPVGGVATVSTFHSSFDTVLGVYTLMDDYIYEAASNDDMNSLFNTSLVRFLVRPGETYYIVVAGYEEGFDPAMGTIDLSVQLGPYEKAAAWARPDLTGFTVSSSSFAGKVVILDFWATWCGPCRSEIPDFNALQTKYGADGLVIIGASTDSSAQTVLTFMNTSEAPPNYQLVMANTAMTAAFGGMDSIPTTFIIDRDNAVRSKFIGTRSASTFEREIIPLLYTDVRLESHMEGCDLVLTWPKTGASFTLKSSSTIENPVWTTWADQPAVVDGRNRVILPKDDQPRFFRLELNY